MPRWSPFLLPLLWTLGCAPGLVSTAPPPGGPNQGSRDAPDPDGEHAVRRVLADQVAAWNRGDLEGYMAGYWRSPQLTFYAGGSVTTGWDETLARYRRRYQGEGKAMGTLDFVNLQVEVLGPSAALARGRWVLHFAPAGPGLSPAKPLQGLFTVLLRHLPEGWRVIHDHSCAD